MVNSRRLLVVSLADRQGGAERSMLALTQELAADERHGWTPTVALPPGEFADLAERAGVTVERIQWHLVGTIRHASGGRHVLPYSVRRTALALVASAHNVRLLRRVIRDTRCDVVLSNSSAGHLFAAVAGRLAHRPVVWHQRDIVSPGPGRAVLQVVGRLVAGVFAISPAVEATMRHPRVYVVPNPVAVPAEVAAGRARAAAAPGDRPVVGFIGRTDPEKGIEELLRAMVGVPAQLLVVGAPAYGPAGWADRLPGLADDLGIDATFAGAVSEPWSSLAAMDVLAVPSWNEPWGRVAAEALCAGVPVVASRAGGLPEIVTDGVDGFLVPPRDVAALHDALRSIVEDRELRSRLAAGTRGSVTRFSTVVHGAAVARLLDEIVSSTRRAPAAADAVRSAT